MKTKASWAILVTFIVVFFIWQLKVHEETETRLQRIEAMYPGL